MGKDDNAAPPADGDEKVAEWERRYLDAVEIWRQGRSEEAALELRAIRDSAPDDEQRGICVADEAAFLTSAGRLREARDLLELARKLLPRGGQYDLRLGLGAVSLDYMECRFEEVVQAAGALVRRHGDLLASPEWRSFNAELRADRAMALAELGRHEEALPALEEALRLGTEESHLLYYIGLCQAHLKRYAEAKEAVSRALAQGLEPHWVASARQVMGLAEWGLGAHGRALRELETAEALAEPGSRLRAVIRQNLALMWRYLGRDNEAARYERLAAGE